MRAAPLVLTIVAAVGVATWTGAAGETPDGPRVVTFSGYEWRVKRSDAPTGPGPNAFSDAPDSVWVDAAGRLHLRIRERDGLWWCAEVISRRSFGYGTYRFQIATSPATLDPNMVLGLFTWLDDPAFHHRELDVEIGQWGEPEGRNAQFVLQPWQTPGNRLRFMMPPHARSAVHTIAWSAEMVRFRSVADGRVVRDAAFARGVPPPGGENARINLWLLGGLPPAGRGGGEVVVERFEFLPDVSH